MMILRKPISILTAILFLTSSMVFSASETTDSLQVATAPATTEVEAHGEHAEEAKSPKEVVNAHIQHHLQCNITNDTINYLTIGIFIYCQIRIIMVIVIPTKLPNTF